MNDLTVKWIDRDHEPKNPPNPKYPFGVDIDVSKGNRLTCSTLLPYPAQRIGFYIINCDRCGQSAMISTAGRPDDPRSVKLACRGI
jgi:hypothetical protein